LRQLIKGQAHENAAFMKKLFSHKKNNFPGNYFFYNAKNII